MSEIDGGQQVAFIVMHAVQYASLTQPDIMPEINESYGKVHDDIKELRGATYFIQNNPNDYHPRKYVESLGAFGHSNPLAAAKDYNKIIA
ncbi:hypothetical protein BGZ76_002695 [Entomortierella beljakovae]|nr:hypothetical protein BGZ76_002695 [Entomortierella beljakovae]